MLLRFGVANHRSIRDYQELLLSASKRIKHTGLTIPVPTLKEAAVPAVAIYGPNAAGKSNLIDAMDEMQSAIVNSHSSLGATDRIPRAPFRLDDTAGARPTRFDCTFTLGRRGGGDREPGETESVYEYGFEYTAKEFRKEWLYRLVRKERQSTRKLFERDTQDGRVRVNSGGQLRGENRTIANMTRPNSLFLSAAAQNNHPQLTSLYRHFAMDWNVILESGAISESAAAASMSGSEYLDRLMELLRQADVGIREVDVRDTEPDEDEIEFARDFAQLVEKRLSRSGEPSPFTDSILESVRSRKRIQFLHSAAGGGTRPLDFDSESKGTRTLISLLVPALDALSRGSLLVIDELDTSLHPNLARAFVSLFEKKDSNPHGAQLVFSTHDVSLLGSEPLRQDEIWVTDKDRDGASKFTPLTDFKLRSRDDVERAYRYGRLGGVPSVDDFLVDLGGAPSSEES